MQHVYHRMDGKDPRSIAALPLEKRLADAALHIPFFIATPRWALGECPLGSHARAVSSHHVLKMRGSPRLIIQVTMRDRVCFRPGP